ncbi:MAG TPA: hypothetical protein VE131_03125 [Terriglobales bacterium]|nr:hypothetical protein [Terriglobales bacterium]
MKKLLVVLVSVLGLAGLGELASAHMWDGAHPGRYGHNGGYGWNCPMGSGWMPHVGQTSGMGWMGHMGRMYDGRWMSHRGGNWHYQTGRTSPNQDSLQP